MAGPTTPPTVRPIWATGADATVSEPPYPTKVSGWLTDVLKPPYQWDNWLGRLTSQWIDWLANNVAIYDDMRVAIDAVDAGDLVTVFEDDESNGAGVQEVEEATTGTAGVGGIDANGRAVVYAVGNADPIGMIRDLTGANGTGNETDYVRTNTGVVRDIRMDDEIVVAAYNTFIECWDIDGTQRWIVDVGAAAYAVAIGPDAVYAVHRLAPGTGDVSANKHAIRIDKVTGAIEWEYQHSATGASELLAVATNGRQVFVAGDASSYTSGAKVRALNASNGYDATNEGGTGTDTDLLAWNSTGAAANVTALDIGHGFVFVGYDAGGTNIGAHAQGDGRTRWTYAHPDTSLGVNHISVDQDYLLVCFSDGAATAVGKLQAHRPSNGSLTWTYAKWSGALYYAPLMACSDGSKIYAVGEDDANIWRITRGNVPTTFRRAGNDENDRIRNWILQPTHRRTA